MSVLLPSDISGGMLNKKNTKNAKVTNSNGETTFGVMPRLNDKFPSGNITLKLGDSGFYDHKTKTLKGAFGLRHIWDKHRSEINAGSAEDVVTFVENVLTTGAEVLLDHNKDPNKPLIVESTHGMLVVELKEPQGEEPYYSVITAYVRKSHPGTLLGKI